MRNAIKTRHNTRLLRTISVWAISLSCLTATTVNAQVFKTPSEVAVEVEKKNTSEPTTSSATKTATNTATNSNILQTIEIKIGSFAQFPYIRHYPRSQYRTQAMQTASSLASRIANDIMKHFPEGAIIDSLGTNQWTGIGSSHARMERTIKITIPADQAKSLLEKIATTRPYSQSAKGFIARTSHAAIVYNRVIPVTGTITVTPSIRVNAFNPAAYGANPKDPRSMSFARMRYSSETNRLRSMASYFLARTDLSSYLQAIPAIDPNLKATLSPDRRTVSFSGKVPESKAKAVQERLNWNKVSTLPPPLQGGSALLNYSSKASLGAVELQR